MNGGVKGSGSWLKLHYDKIITVIMLSALAFSLVYLAVRIGMIRRMQDQHAERIDSYQPAYPTAAPAGCRGNGEGAIRPAPAPPSPG